jgi:hypothetical protein
MHHHHTQTDGWDGWWQLGALVLDQAFYKIQSISAVKRTTGTLTSDIKAEASPNVPPPVIANQNQTTVYNG